MGEAGPAGQEGVGAEGDRAVGVVDQLRHDAVVQRRGVVEGAHAGEQRQQRAAGQAERVEHRHGVEHAVGGVEVDHRGDLGDVGQDVAVAEHDALRRPFRPAGEQHDRGGIGRRARTGKAPGARASSQPRSLAPMPRPARTSSSQTKRTCRLHPLHHRAELGLLDEGAGWTARCPRRRRCRRRACPPPRRRSSASPARGRTPAAP